jgi:import inner membrane translocase subunit TIM13
MSGFSSIFGSGGSSKSDGSIQSSHLSTSTSSANTAELKRQVQEQIGQELAIANATELVNVSLGTEH